MQTNTYDVSHIAACEEFRHQQSSGSPVSGSEIGPATLPFISEDYSVSAVQVKEQIDEAVKDVASKMPEVSDEVTGDIPYFCRSFTCYSRC